MTAPVSDIEARPLAPLVDILRLMAESAANSWELFAPDLELADVVDPLQDFAERAGLVAAIGQDAVQEIIAEPFAWLRGFNVQEPPPDDYAAQLVKQWEMADLRDRWRHTGEPPPAGSSYDEPYHLVAKDGVASAAELQRMIDGFSRDRNRPAEFTVEAFLYVAANEGTERLAGWLADHQLDAPYLLEIWDRKCTAS